MVGHVSLRSFRSYAELDLALAPGLVLVTGPNGAGKTNLLEALHVG
ncbi:MAG: AAA family ATPase, partial [Gaiellaceae bacterium]